MIIRKLKALLLNDTFIFFLIVTNSLIIFVQGFDLGNNAIEVLSSIDNIITLVFVFEIAAKLHQYGFKKFIKSGWNLFDSVLVLMAVPSLLIWLTSYEGQQLDFLLVLRVARVFKFFRLLKSLPNILHLIDGVKRALKASLLVLLGFFIYNFIISILSCFFYHQIAPKYFGDPIISFYTIFRIFTIEGWYEIPDYIANNSSQMVGALTKFYFLIILLTGGIFGLSIVNSIFVDAMVSDNTNELEKKVSSLEKKIDELIDVNKKNNNS